MYFTHISPSVATSRMSNNNNEDDVVEDFD